MNHADKRRKSWSLWSTKIVSLDPTLTVATVHKSRMLWQVHPSHAAKESKNQPQNHVAEREASWGSSCDREEMIIVQPRVKYRTLYTVLFCARCQVATNSHGKSRLATAAIRSALSFPTMAQSSAATGYAPSSSEASHNVPLWGAVSVEGCNRTSVKRRRGTHKTCMTALCQRHCSSMHSLSVQIQIGCKEQIKNRTAAT